MIDKLLEFAKQAGQVALDMQSKVDFYSSDKKSDSVADVVTQADLAISRMLYEFIQSEFADLDYIIVEEESEAELGDNPMEKIHAHEYAFIVDPIDGTLSYSIDMPFWGISIGVYKNQKPYCAVIYMPALNELIWADEKSVHLVKNPWTEKEVSRELKPASAPPAPVLAFKAYHMNLTSAYDKKTMKVYDYPCIVLKAVNAAIGRSTGAVIHPVNIWDLAGPIVIAERMGASVRYLSDGRQFDLFSDIVYEHFWHDPIIVCHPEYFEMFQKILEVRK